jgi:hypothetical protein
MMRVPGNAVSNGQILRGALRDERAKIAEGQFPIAWGPTPTPDALAPSRSRIIFNGRARQRFLYSRGRGCLN